MGSGKKLRKSEVLHGHDDGKNAGIRRQECDMWVVKHGQEVSEKSEGVSEERVALVWLEKHEKTEQKTGVDIRADARASCCLLQNVLVNHQNIHGLQCDGQREHWLFGGRPKDTW